MCLRTGSRDGSLGFVGEIFSALGLHDPEFLDSSLHGSAEATFVPAEVREGSAVVGEGLEGEGAAGFFIDHFVLFPELGGLPVHLVIEGGCFRREAAIEAPASGDDVTDEVSLGFVGGLPAGDICLEETVILFVAFVREDDDFAGEAVADGVLRRSLLAGCGDGPAGLRAVDPRCFGLFEATHTWWGAYHAARFSGGEETGNCDERKGVIFLKAV